MADGNAQWAYDGLECGECGDPIEPGVWCGNDDCMLGNDGPKPSREAAEAANDRSNEHTSDHR